MGIAIATTPSGTPIPRPLHITLTCDGEGFFFNHVEFHYRGPSFVDAHSEAMRAGWKETFDADGARIWLCPDCSGKHKGRTATE